MNKNRLEAFSDGVLAIIITIMVLEFKIPEGVDCAALRPLLPKFLSYVLSFIYIGIYWNNHHHMMHTVRRVNGAILWANLHLLFWLSLIPFATAWNGDHQFAPFPMLLYGVILLMNGVAYYVLQGFILEQQGENSLLKRAIGRDYKGKSSPILYCIAIGFATSYPIISGMIYIFVALMWLVPDKRIERVFEEEDV
jgi:uncharacterized membrane protein